MQLITDLHIHSHFAYATSKDLTLESLYKWGKIKGISVIGTGDFTHPLWQKEIEEKLEPAEQGLFKLKDSIAKTIDDTLPQSFKDNLFRFILTAEISTEYYKKDKYRKIHSLIIAPDLHFIKNISKSLEKYGNLAEDGRPTLNLDCKNLLNIALQTNSESLFIPAHIWTPWFGMFGSKSGFDSLQETFEELTPHIRAIETGLSSDPFMNWQIKDLDNITITSHSDAHSPQKLGREATIIDARLSYKDITDAIKTNDQRLIGTIEFFPQEGKYHYDGHRACNICFTPQQTKEHNGICPVCHKKLTVGVEYRIDQLASRPLQEVEKKKVEYIIPLLEIIAEIKNLKTIASKGVQEEYKKAYTTLGDEFSILRSIPIDTITQSGFPQLAKSIEKMRKREVTIQPGYDGVFGKVKVL